VCSEGLFGGAKRITSHRRELRYSAVFRTGTIGDASWHTSQICSCGGLPAERPGSHSKIVGSSFSRSWALSWDTIKAREKDPRLHRRWKQVHAHRCSTWRSRFFILPSSAGPTFKVSLTLRSLFQAQYVYSWESRLPKSGKAHDQAIDQLKSAGIPTMATPFHELASKLISKARGTTEYRRIVSGH
jgi:hypothetical protein